MTGCHSSDRSSSLRASACPAFIGFHRAVGYDRGGDVEHHRRFLAGIANATGLVPNRFPRRARRVACGWRWRRPNEFRPCYGAPPFRHKHRPRPHDWSGARPAQATPVSFASWIAVWTRCITARWPMPLSPSTMAVAGAVLVTSIFGRGLMPPALIRLTCAVSGTRHARRRREKVGLHHQDRDLYGVLARHSEGEHAIADQRFDRASRRAWHATSLPPASSFFLRPLRITIFVEIETDSATIWRAFEH